MRLRLLKSTGPDYKAWIRVGEMASPCEELSYGRIHRSTHLRCDREMFHKSAIRFNLIFKYHESTQQGVVTLHRFRLVVSSEECEEYS